MRIFVIHKPAVDADNILSLFLQRCPIGSTPEPEKQINMEHREHLLVVVHDGSHPELILGLPQGLKRRGL